MFSNVAVKSLGDITSPSLTPLMVGNSEVLSSIVTLAYASLYIISSVSMYVFLML